MQYWQLLLLLYSTDKKVSDPLELYTAAAIIGILAGRSPQAVQYKVEEVAELASEIAIQTNAALKNKTNPGIK